MPDAQAPYRPCDICGGVDTHPRHSFAGVIPDEWAVNDARRADLDANLEALHQSGKIDFPTAMQVAAAFMDTTSTDRHIDCCAEAGCPKAGTVDGCDQRVAVWNGKTGSGMVAAAAKVREQNADHYATTEG